MRRAVCVLLLAASPALAEDDRRGPDDSFFAGTYEIVGRLPGEGGATFTGHATLAVDGDQLSVKRCIGDRVTTGHLKYEEWGGDRLIFLKGAFDDGLLATCEFGVDNDNYARLSCYTYPPDDPHIEVPGLELFVVARWKFPDNVEACR